MDEVVKHTAGLASDNGMSFGAAAVEMANRLDNVEAREIISRAKELDS